MRILIGVLLLTTLGAITVCQAADLPLSQVVLFSSGVGYFERQGDITGNATIELSFRTEQINDILKSMVLMDTGGGTVAPVTYAPQDPLERTLGSFALNISDNPGMRQLWDRLRGTKVQVTHESSSIIEGIVMSSEEQEKSVGENTMTFDVFNLLTDKGMVSIPLWQIKNIKLLDAKLNTDLRSALDALDKSRDVSKRPVTVSFLGDTKRNVRMGYLLETPVWKTTYRLVSDKDGLFLQGWAIVENTTDDDWNDVNLSLVSGRPVSFTQDLYSPLYTRRANVPVSVATAAAPRVWEGAMEMPEALMEAENMMMDDSAPRKAGRRAEMAMAPGMMGPGGGMGGGMMMAPPSPAPISLSDMGVEAMAGGEKVGTLFKYGIKQPVTVPRKRSAMLPIINSKIEGEQVDIFNRNAHPKFPMNGIKLKNSTGLHLMGGAVTVFEGGIYGGDALLEDVVPGDERLITYAMDLSVEVDIEEKSAPQQMVSGKISNGVLLVTSKQQMTTSYIVKNNGDEAKTILVEHPANTDWTLISPDKPAETTRNNYRFKVAVEPRKSTRLNVVQERVNYERMELLGYDINSLMNYVYNGKFSQGVKDAVAKLQQLKAEEARFTAELQEKTTRITEIDAEQERIRKNMRELDRTNELYKQYVTKLTAQETEFETLRGESETLRKQLTNKQAEIADYIKNLTIE